MVLFFNLQLTFCSLKYSLSYLVELFREEHTLLKSKVLYLETQSARYEFSMHTEGMYKLAQVAVPHQITVNEMSNLQVPLPAEYVSDCFCDIAWNEIEWGVCGLKIRNVQFPIVKMLVWSRTQTL